MALTPEDRFQIQDLYARYRHAVDDLDGEAWADCFTEDGEFVPGAGPIAGTPYVGREAIAALGADPNREPPSRHWSSDPVLTEHDGYVAGVCYALLVDIHGSRPELTAASVYRDELVKVDGDWRFRSRRSQGDVEKLADP